MERLGDLVALLVGEGLAGERGEDELVVCRYIDVTDARVQPVCCRLAGECRRLCETGLIT